MDNLVIDVASNCVRGAATIYLGGFIIVAVIAYFELLKHWESDRMYLTSSGWYQDKWDVYVAKAYLLVVTFIILAAGATCVGAIL